MATLKQLRTRVASIKNIQRVTNAMQLVAAARMRKAQEDILAARPYADKLENILRRLSGSVDTTLNPMFVERPVERLAVALITSDRGLCGGFNSSVSRQVTSLASESEGIDLSFAAIGRKGRSFLVNRDYNVVADYMDVFRDLAFPAAASIAGDLTSRFVSGEVDRVVLVYNEFRSVSQQIPVAHQLLPIVPAESVEDESEEFIFEPDPRRLMDSLVPRHVNFQVWRALLESNAGEQASRMQAMDNATKNAGDLIEQLTQDVNKARQSTITLELMDIIGGAEAVV
ncbi:MAG: ATP synthase F1 subunit gamma [Gemmatimonadetes bacterium]|nr:ATP synthase F1 subunit gamma [Gemmatimonadota bacterium]